MKKILVIMSVISVVFLVGCNENSNTDLKPNESNQIQMNDGKESNVEENLSVWKSEQKKWLNLFLPEMNTEQKN